MSKIIKNEHLVLMSIYNGEKYLNKSISSVLDQSYKILNSLLLMIAQQINQKN